MKFRILSEKMLIVRKISQWTRHVSGLKVRVYLHFTLYCVCNSFNIKIKFNAGFIGVGDIEFVKGAEAKNSQKTENYRGLKNQVVDR